MSETTSTRPRTPANDGLLRKLLIILCVSAGLLAGADQAAAAAKKPDRAAQARALAGKVVAAKTDAKRRTALLGVFKALKIGVYTGKGKAVVRGAERRRGDLHLYDAEVRAIAARLGKKTTVDRAGLAAQVASLGIRKRGRAKVTATDLQRGLTRAVTRAKRNKRRLKGLGTLVVADIARRQKRALTGPKARYDALQTTILMADLVSRRHSARAKAAASASTVARLAHPAQAAPKPCFPGAGRLVKGGTGVGGFWEEVEDIGKGISNLAASVIHGPAIAALVDFSLAPTGQVTNTHYGRAGHHYIYGGKPGTQLVFRVEVDMLADVPEKAITCGALAGLKFPKKGPVPDVPINWDGIISSGIETLGKHGAIDRKDEKTGADGIATLTFRPKDEILPAVGKESFTIDVLQPEAEIFTAFGNAVGAVNEAIIPMSESIGFTIGHHKPKGYTFKATTQELCFYIESCGWSAQKNTFTYEAKVCGEDPYGKEWTGTKHTRSRQYDDEISERTEPLNFVLFKDKTSTWYRPGFEARNDNRADFTLLDGTNSRMWVDSYYSNNFKPGQANYRAYEDHQKVQVFEASDCPAQ